MARGPESRKISSKESRAAKFDAKAERRTLTAEIMARIATDESVAEYTPMLDLLDQYDLLNDEKEREVLAVAYRKERANFLVGPQPAAAEAPPTEPKVIETVVEEAGGKEEPTDGAKARFVWKERPKVNRQVLAVAAEVRAYGIDPEQDLPNEWKRLSRANKSVRGALTAYENNDGSAESDQRLLDQYHAKLEEFKAAREAVRAALKASEPLLAEHTIEAHAIPLADEIAIFGSRDTFAGERNRMREPLRERIEEALSRNPEPEDAPAVAVSQPAAPKTSRDPLGENEDGKPIVMLNPVLYKQAMGGTFKRLKNPNFPAVPVPPGMTPAGFIHKKEQNRRKKELKETLARWLPTGLVAGAAALWLFAAGDGEKSRQVEPSKKGTGAVAESTDLKPGPAKLTGASTTPFVPSSVAALDSLVDAAMAAETPKAPEMKRIKKPPALPMYRGITKEERMMWDQKSKDWMSTYYPQGYAQARSDTVRMEMVQALGYPLRKKAVPKPEAPKVVAPEPAEAGAVLAAQDSSQGVVPLEKHMREQGREAP